ncbi:glutamate 5-kinase [Akkermansiaceae bacterium]|nr:glutamate 5-kinase [Akkermansiaceae bacterium]
MSKENESKTKDLTVLKIGTGVLTRDKDGKLDNPSLLRLVLAVAELVKSGHPFIMVSSGAVSAGVSALGLKNYPKDTKIRQACAAVGQLRLMYKYKALFENFDLDVAQLLLTSDDLLDEERKKGVIDTLEVLHLQDHIIPIINENDSISTEEITFGDNDMLSARIAGVLQAKRLIFLTSVDGLYPPNSTEILDRVDNIQDVYDYAKDESGKFSIGGMRSKLSAVNFALEQGVETIIANGRNPKNIAAIVNGGGIGTRFTV